MANYLITGAAGFIGARTAEMLIADGHTVVGIDNLNNAYDMRMKDYRLKRLQALSEFTFHQLDISHKSIIEHFKSQKFDGVINMAAWAGVRVSVENPWIYVESNMTGTLNPPYPTPESASSSEVLQPYAASKKGAEAMAHAYHHLHGIDVTILRFFTVYGPAGRPDLSIFRFVQWVSEGRPVRVNGDGEQSRGFTYIDDIARGIILALKPVGFEIFNIGGHEVITINNLIKLVEDVVGKKANVQYGPANPADMFMNHADVSKAETLLGWEPQYGMRAGIEKLVEWYNEEREWAKDVITT